MYKNVAGQKIIVRAWDSATGLAKSGDAAQITATVSKDGAADVATNDVTPVEIGSTGAYVFDMIQAESAADLVSLTAVSSTGGIVLDPVDIYTFDLSAFAAAVWAATTRTLTGFGTLIADIWANAARTITGGTVGTVTDGAKDSTVAKEATKFNPAADTVARVTLVDTTTVNTDQRGTDGASTHSAADVWLATTRTLTGFGTLVADIATAVWAAAVRSLTDKLGFAPTVDDVWDEPQGGHTTAGTFGFFLDAKVSNATGGGIGVGALTVTILDSVTTAPVVGAIVQLTDTVGSGSYFGGATTDGNGDAVIDAQAVGNYTIVSSADGFEIPDTAVTITASAVAAQIDAVQKTVNPPVDPDFCTLFGYVLSMEGVPLEDREINVTATSDATPAFVDDNGYSKRSITTTTDAAGFFSLEVVKDVEIDIVVDALSSKKITTTLVDDTKNIADI